MTCREFADFMLEYVSGELPSDVRRAFEHHLSLCDNCVQYLADYKQTIELGKRAFEDEGAPVPASIPEELVTAILASRRRT